MRTIAFLVGASLLLCLPTTSAHDCEAEDPATTCGNCTTGNHSHTYRDGRVYCESDDGSILCLSSVNICLP